MNMETSPKNDLYALYGNAPRNRQINVDNYISWNDGGPDHLLKWTSIFICPRTGEIFKSGRYGDPGSYRASSCNNEEIIWYTQKKLAEQGAAALALDCQNFRDSSNASAASTPDRLGDDEPYLPTSASSLPLSMPLKEYEEAKRTVQRFGGSISNSENEEKSDSRQLLYEIDCEGMPQVTNIHQQHQQEAKETKERQQIRSAGVNKSFEAEAAAGMSYQGSHQQHQQESNTDSPILYQEDQVRYNVETVDSNSSQGSMYDYSHDMIYNNHPFESGLTSIHCQMPPTRSPEDKGISSALEKIFGTENCEPDIRKGKFDDFDSNEDTSNGQFDDAEDHFEGSDNNECDVAHVVGQFDNAD